MSEFQIFEKLLGTLFLLSYPEESWLSPISVGERESLPFTRHVVVQGEMRAVRYAKQQQQTWLVLRELCVSPEPRLLYTSLVLADMCIVEM